MHSGEAVDLTDCIFFNLEMLVARQIVLNDPDSPVHAFCPLVRSSSVPEVPAHPNVC